ncbi:YqeG family HAD IIIA-type phosphatase [Deinococcus pimensis]|uniref:YqeG family HAD IIIA-type phosphatase n=1 Tax=Deinococcus pimensis TaxID=309888 RepID=UPI0004BA41B7|nr:YqeG family HAD IIIA-type phosphatase [Deinococcus pimensis]
MSVLRPRLVLDHVTEITPDLMADHDLHGLLLDLDNTLIEYGSYREAREVQTWASELMLRGVRLYLLSNAMPERVRFWTERLGFAGIGLASKPNPQSFHRAARRMDLAPGQVAMVGDQLFTDVLGGNLAGMFTIMVRPLADNALPHTKLARRVERLVLRRYGLQHGRPTLNPTED